MNKETTREIRKGKEFEKFKEKSIRKIKKKK